MPDLMVVIDGVPVPLADCSWVLTLACGHVAKVAIAADSVDVYATEQQIHEEMTPLKRDRAREVAGGFTWELMTFEAYKARYGGPDAWKCRHTRAQRHGKAPLDTAPACHCGQPIPAGRKAYCSPGCRLADKDHGPDEQPGGASRDPAPAVL